MSCPLLLNVVMVFLLHIGNIRTPIVYRAISFMRHVLECC